MVRIGLLGCGKIGERHFRAYRGLADVELVMADADPERGRALAQSGGVPFVSPDELFQDSSIHAVDVCVPTPFHRDAILRAIAVNKHVFCEKPLCASLAEAEEIRRAMAGKKLHLMVGYLYRFHPALQFVKRIVEEQVIGRPYFALLRLGGRGSHQPWKHVGADGGGAILEMMVHKIDLARWLFGDIRHIRLLTMQTVLRERRIAGNLCAVDAEDLVVLQLEPEGVQVLCESDLLTPSYMNTLEIQGSYGSVFSSILEYLPTIVYCAEPRGTYQLGNNFFHFDRVNLFTLELGHFVKSLHLGFENCNSLEDSVRVLEIVEEVRRQAQQALATG